MKTTIKEMPNGLQIIGLDLPSKDVFYSFKNNEVDLIIINNVRKSKDILKLFISNSIIIYQKNQRMRRIKTPNLIILESN